MAATEQKLETISINDKLIVFAASLLALWVSYRLFYRVYEIEPDEKSIEIGSIETSGMIRRRHARSLAWGDVKGSSKLYLRDIVITPKDAGATVHWGKDQSLVIEPDTMVQFDEVNNDRVQIVLFEGKVKQAPAKSEKEPVRPVIVKKEEMIRIIPYPKTYRLMDVARNDGSESYLAKLSDRLQTVLKKQPTLAPLVAVQSPQFQLDRVTDYQIRLLSPARGQFNVRKTKWIKFAWDFPALPNTKFQIEISKERDFERALSHATVQKELELQFADPAVYYWRVKAVREKESVVSLISYFEMFAKSGTAAFSRLPTGQPTGYAWELASDTKFDKVVKNGVANEPKCQTESLKPATYYCRVREVTTNRVVKLYSLEYK